MRTNIDIDDNLMATAQKISKIKTKKLMVEKALQVYIGLENQKKILDFWGKVEIDEEAYK
ncbi:type II toxin-antitoxin system VapB family antitoxin [Mucilaginibacter psychrotolerans]|uniref:Type II toxin-antitoxin system VapB family antitoxin n=1 Tax=Mucilaginibacter psychrotolerans TaxID=1524096 RepID=A0A4Y8SFM7_9SPHI|nr:type II toxin-antitoxin system VapB family antitoxin [Mucilaginibacter psychrotolerans]TFF37455.1 type II toxin-antitoxin system VapB family antitoxin [Mucilaginibacter psychrotolerans]